MGKRPGEFEAKSRPLTLNFSQRAFNASQPTITYHHQRLLRGSNVTNRTDGVVHKPALVSLDSWF